MGMNREEAQKGCEEGETEEEEKLDENKRKDIQLGANNQCNQAIIVRQTT